MEFDRYASPGHYTLTLASSKRGVLLAVRPWVHTPHEDRSAHSHGPVAALHSPYAQAILPRPPLPNETEATEAMTATPKPETDTKRPNVLFVLASIVTSTAGLFAGEESGETLFADSFDTTPDGPPSADWKTVGGKWEVRGGALRGIGDARIMVAGREFSDCAIECTVQFEKVRNSSRWLSIVYRANPGGKPPYAQFAVRQNSRKRNGLEFAMRTESDESIPTLEAALRDLKGKTVPVIEVKEAHTARPVVDAVRRAEMVDDVVIISFKDQLLSNFVVNEIVNFVEAPRRTPVEFATKLTTEFTTKLVAAQPPLFRREVCEKA